MKALRAMRRKNGRTSLTDKKNERIAEYPVKKFIAWRTEGNSKSEPGEPVGVLKCQIVDKIEESQDSLDGIINVLEKGLKSGKNLDKLKIMPLPLNYNILELTDEEKEIIKGKIKFKKSLERFDKVIKESRQLKKASNNNNQFFRCLSLMSGRSKIKKDRSFEEYSNLLEKLTSGFKKFYTATDRFVVIPPVASEEWSGFVKELLCNKYLLSKINFTRHEILSLFICHGFIIDHVGKSRLSVFAEALLANKYFNPYKGKIFEKYPLMDIRTQDFYNGYLLKKNSFIKAVIKKYYGIGMAEFKKRFLEKKGSLFSQKT